MEKSKILLTGKPGIGKTTAVKRIMSKLEGITIKGFYTEELRVNEKREGFIIKGISSNKTEIFAHIEFKDLPKIGKYGVNTGALDEIVKLEFSEPYPNLFVIDEIGPMECLSKRFSENVLKILNMDIPLLGTIKEKGDRFIEKIKSYPGVELYRLTSENRDFIVERILEKLRYVLG